MGTRAARTLAALTALALAPGARAADMNPHLAPLAPLLGKTFRGVVSAAGAASPAVDEDGAFVFHEVVKGSAEASRR